MADLLKVRVEGANYPTSIRTTCPFKRVNNQCPFTENMCTYGIVPTGSSEVTMLPENCPLIDNLVTVTVHCIEV